jgi:tRNA threonylcarbamoyladenosine biosynthesis protein TsaB
MTDLPQRLLAFDAAGAACSAAVWAEGGLAARRFVEMRRGQSEHLMPMIEAVMAEGGLAYGELDLIAVTRGPGGFTGVRIGLATARALALAARRPLLGIDNFTVVAAGLTAEQRRGRTLAVLLDAKRSDLYAAVYDADGRLRQPPTALAPAALAAQLPDGPLLLAGDAVDQIRPLLAARQGEIEVAREARLADAAVLADLAAATPLSEVPEAAPEPLYLRPPDVTPPRQGRS